MCDLRASKRMSLSLLAVLRCPKGLRNKFKSICLVALGSFSGAKAYFHDNGSLQLSNKEAVWWPLPWFLGFG